MSNACTIMWLRRDLRLDDHPALAAAARRGAVVPVYVHDDEEALGGAASWWLHESLARLQSALERLGSRLVVRRGPAERELLAAAREAGADAAHWQTRYEPDAARRDRRVAEALRNAGLTVETFGGALLFEPSSIATKQGTPYKVFTPYYRTCLAQGVADAPVAAPKALAAPARWPASSALEELGLVPRIPWYREMAAFWEPGEAGARARLAAFGKGAAARYEAGRDAPGTDGTSRLSPHLAFGEISPRRIWHALGASKATAPYLRQIVWREFAYNLLHHFPETVSEPLRPEFAAFPWQGSAAELEAWQKGRTGYPLVDAGMRQLWSLGWMHNRVRMVVASFLVKHLMIDWKAGAAWFDDTLVDADLANNTFGWQWTAGCGADAAPFDRVFNPVLQGKRFDGDGEYVRRWVPELADLPDAYLHKPFEAPASVLRDAGVVLGKTYPKPLVEHQRARARALLAFDRMRAKARAT